MCKLNTIIIIIYLFSLVQELKDKNDELTMEVEDLKQNLSSNRRSKRSTRNREGVILAGKTGSFLTETGQASDEASGKTGSY